MYFNEFYVLHEQKQTKVIVRNYTQQDFKQMIALQAACFPPPFLQELWWNETQLLNHTTYFPDGAICVELNGEIVGSMTSLLVHFNIENAAHTWEEITDNGYITTHNKLGNTLDIVDLCVHPSFRHLGLGKWMMQAMYHVVIERKLIRLLGGGRMPGYKNVAAQYTPQQYVDAVLNGVVKDPVLTFLLRCGRSPIKVVENYLQDEESKNYGVLMEWKNPFIQQTFKEESFNGIRSYTIDK